MKRVILPLMFAVFASMANAATVKVDRIDPTDWYVGMKDPTLQLMVYGDGIRETDVTTDYAGARIDSVARLDSPNYLLVYLNIGDARPGTMKLKFTARKGGKAKGSQTVSYRLKAREMEGSRREGFTNADVLYMLMPDRFASSGKYTTPQATKRLEAELHTYRVDRSAPSLRHGGDLEGIRRHLDYFNELGITALWITPVLENNSPDNALGYSTYHGYATTDYYRVDPRFGTNGEYRQLTDEAHAKGLKVVMDMIFNHCGFEHPWVADMPSADWFNLHGWLKESGGTSNPEGTSFMQTSYKLTPVIDPYASEIDKKETTEGWFVPTMPDLNQRNPHVMKYLIQNSMWWIETVGIDGIRMDTYPYADAGAMARWMEAIDEEYPNFNVVGETWVTEAAYTAAWQGNSRIARDNSHLKTVMDFSFFDRFSKAKDEETDAWWEGLNRIYNSLLYDYLYENPDNVMAFIDNHDTDRFLGDGCDTLSLKQALALLLTIRRTPQIYYGTEILMSGTKEITDGDVRCDFPGGFPGDKHNAFTAAGRSAEENAMFNWLSRLLHWRRGNDVVTRGGMKHFIPYNGIYVVSREYNGRGVAVILNGTTTEQTFDTDRYAELFAGNANASTDGEGRIVVRTKDVTTGMPVVLRSGMRLPPRQTLILEY